MKNIIDFVLGAFCTLLIGYAIAYPQTPIIDQIDAWKFFFHLVFQATASTIVSGAMAERTDIRAYIILTTIISGIIYSFSVRWTWEAAGLPVWSRASTTSRVPGLCTRWAARPHSRALWSSVPARAAGRTPKSSCLTPCHRSLSGVLLLWVGWYGFNPGSTGTTSSAYDAMAASNAAMTTTISASSSGLVVMTYHLVKSK